MGAAGRGAGGDPSGGVMVRVENCSRDHNVGGWQGDRTAPTTVVEEPDEMLANDQQGV